LLIAFSFYLYYTKEPANSYLQYVGYAIYAAGIAWTLIGYFRSPNYSGKFGDIFGQGFRCFIVVALIMVVFQAVYVWLHPGIIEEAARMYKADLVTKGNKTPAEIEALVETSKKQFLTGTIMGTIFGTLILGAVFTAAGAGLLLIRKK